eukprot:2287794-Rhodomonas_salina.3
MRWSVVAAPSRGPGCHFSTSLSGMRWHTLVGVAKARRRIGPRQSGAREGDGRATRPFISLLAILPPCPPPSRLQL